MEGVTMTVFGRPQGNQDPTKRGLGITQRRMSRERRRTGHPKLIRYFLPPQNG